jgi:hypothetical protein
LAVGLHFVIGTKSFPACLLCEHGFSTSWTPGPVLCGLSVKGDLMATIAN